MKALRDSDNENDSYPPAKRKKVSLPSMTFQVPSLMRITIDYVASNLHHVESFFGFPDIVGQEIFRRADLMKVFDISNDGESRCLQLFIESYGAQVLSHLNLSGCHLGVNYALDNLLQFKSLEELDLSSCGLGDNHELLPYIGHLESLTRLNLSSNCLTDEGIRKLTTPYRVCGRGPQHLKICDISDNPKVTNKSIQRLSSFTHLHTIDVTKTQIKGDTVLSRQWQFKPLKSDCLLIINTKGWAADVVSRWMKFAEQKISKEIRREKKFYSKSHLKKDFNNMPSKLHSAPGYHLLLVRLSLQSVQSIRSASVHQYSQCKTLSSKGVKKEESSDKLYPVDSLDEELLTAYSVKSTFHDKDIKEPIVACARQTKHLNVFKLHNETSKCTSHHHSKKRK